jgi:TonB-dependent SusC/RagA subfamily outer membrane receptor
MIMGTTYGNITDLDGKYTLNILSTETRLLFSYVGYQTVEEYVGNRTVIDVFMNVDVEQLDELIVTGYSTEARKNISGAVSTADPEEIKTMPTGNVTEQLAGRIAGVNVLHTGKPGGPVNVRIRGYTTINDNGPLYIIDGAPADQATIEMLNPNDVESIVVLKDASAASIYGSRAANGVIIYTTKTGEGIDKNNITFEGYAGVQYVNNFPEMCNPGEVADIIRASLENAGKSVEVEGQDYKQYYLMDSDGNFVRWGLPDYIVPAGYAVDIRGPIDESSYKLGSLDSAYTLANKEGTNLTDQV